MNQIYIKDQFLMIRDGDGKDRAELGRQLCRYYGERNLETEEDVKEHMEEIRIYMRGHNLFDIFYGKFRDEEQELLKRYIEIAPREDFADILDAVEQFVYFESRRHGV